MGDYRPSLFVLRYYGGEFAWVREVEIELNLALQKKSSL